MEIKQRNDPRSWTAIPAISEKKPKNIQGNLVFSNELTT